MTKKTGSWVCGRLNYVSVELQDPLFGINLESVDNHLIRIAENFRREQGLRLVSLQNSSDVTLAFEDAD